MAVTVTVYVPDPDGVLAAYGAGALVRLERESTEITTLPLVSGQTVYTHLDTGGSSTAEYRTRYSNSSGSITSEYSAPWRPGDIRLYAEPAEVARRLAIAGGDELWPICRQVSEWIERVVGRALAPLPDATLVLDGDDALDRRRIAVPAGIRNLTSVEVAPGTGGTWDTVPAGEWFLRRLNPLDTTRPYDLLVLSDVSSHIVWPGLGNVRLTGAFGWPVVPEDVRGVALNLAVAVWRAQSAGGADGVVIGEDGTRTISRLISSLDWQTLQRYRLRRIA